MIQDSKEAREASPESRTVLLTGASGFIGSRIARRLRVEGWRVRAIVRAQDPSPDLTGVEQVVGDFADPAVARDAGKGMSVVIHSAATAGPDRESAMRVNVGGTASIAAAALANGSDRFVQISTASVYRTDGLAVIDEESPLLGADADPYGATKAEADRVVLEHSRRDGLGATILRLGAVLGVHPTSTWGVKVPNRIRTEPELVLRPRARTMPWVHVEDVVDAVLLTLASEAAIGRVYNLMDEHNTWGDYVDRVRSWFGMGPQPEPEGVPRPWTGRFEAGRIRTELGYAFRLGYEQGMEEAADYWRARLVTTGTV
ncbi:MAG TPA: NAD(P)-dependent oxidoreductase [Candidatus Eisenbacteria bacterium]|nr:NAD(P)-dependent oxidoreductase [Candidatus Eisenbacteria bacterium]